jgi:hypothetical protein
MKFGRAKNEAAAAVELPERHEPLIMVLSNGSRMPAAVLESGENNVLFAVTVPVNKPFQGRDLEKLVLEYTGLSGRIRLTGKGVVPDANEPDVLRMDNPSSFNVTQEREFVRLKSSRPVVVFIGKVLQPVQTYTVDISGGGFLLAGPDTLKLGDHLEFQLTIKQGELPVTGAGKVVRKDNAGRFGVLFEKISDLDRRRVVRFIFDVQREERRMGLEEDHG